MGLLKTLKRTKLRIDDWCNKEVSRDAVIVTMKDFLWSEKTGLPLHGYSDEDVAVKADDIYRHAYRVYPTLPSPYYVHPTP